MNNQSAEQSPYRIGDVVNGHQLRADNQWHPIAAAAQRRPSRHLAGNRAVALGGAFASLVAFGVLIGLISGISESDEAGSVVGSPTTSRSQETVEAYWGSISFPEKLRDCEAYHNPYSSSRPLSHARVVRDASAWAGFDLDHATTIGFIGGECESAYWRGNLAIHGIPTSP